MEAGTEAPSQPDAEAPAAPNPEGQTLSGKPLVDLDERADATPDPGAQADVGGAAAVKLAAADNTMSAQGHSTALNWFLSPGEETSELETKVLKLNFGTRDTPTWVDWTIQPVGIDTMRRIRNTAQNSRAAKRTGRVDEYRMNLEVVVAGTKDPNIAEAAQILFAQGQGSNDPAEVLKARFQSKPGYIAQIAGEIMGLSGFDDDDVTEKDAVAAAGN